MIQAMDMLFNVMMGALASQEGNEGPVPFIGVYGVRSIHIRRTQNDVSVQATIPHLITFVRTLEWLAQHRK